MTGSSYFCKFSNQSEFPARSTFHIAQQNDHRSKKYRIFTNSKCVKIPFVTFFGSNICLECLVERVLDWQDCSSSMCRSSSSSTPLALCAGTASDNYISPVCHFQSCWIILKRICHCFETNHTSFKFWQRQECVMLCFGIK